MRSFVFLAVLLSLFLAPQTSLAALGIRDSGCYLLQGKLERTSAKKTIFTISDHSRSELHLQVAANPEIQKMKPGLVESVVYFKKGSVKEQATITLNSKLTKKINSSALSSSKQWVWKSEGKNQQCI